MGHVLKSSISPLIGEGSDSSLLLLRLTGSAEEMCVYSPLLSICA